MGTRPWDKPAFFCLTPQQHRHFGPVCPLGRVGVRPWDDCPARAVSKMFMWFVFIVFFLPPTPCSWLPDLQKILVILDFCRFHEDHTGFQNAGLWGRAPHVL